MIAQPLLFLGDSTDLQTGLSRITRDLAYICAAMPQFKVGALGRGGIGSSNHPFMQYNFPETDQWGEVHIEQVWRDFSRGNKGVIFTVWDATRLLWFGQPKGLDPSLEKFLTPPCEFEKWGYFMLDSTGPDGQTLPLESKAAMQGFDRVLVASEWGANVARASGIECDWMPHGINMDVFNIRPDVRQLLEIDDDQIVVGCVMSNQSRKDWPIAFDTVRLLKAHYGKKLLFWLHTDTPFRYWNASALANDYGVADCMRLTIASQYGDSWMAAFYSACDVTILPSGGEGFGYPIAESMACGTACITGDYAAGPELIMPECRVPPSTYRVDTWHNVLRAVYHANPWAQLCIEQIEKRKIGGEEWKQEIRQRVEHLNWSKLNYPWRKWLLRR